MKLKEVLATLSVLVSLVALPLLIGWYHDSYVLGGHPGATKVITLSGVAEKGVWTLDSRYLLWICWKCRW